MGVNSYNGLGVPPCLNRVYDPEKDAWTTGADVPTNRLEFGVAVVNDKLYAIGGNVYNEIGFISPSAANEQYTPIGFGTVPPVIGVASPENRNYTSSEIALNFTVNRRIVWMGYSLDGKENVTVTGNTTLTGLLSNGLHNVTVYARDEFENTGASETVSFSIELPKPFPTTLVAVILVSVAIVGAGLMVYFVKFKKQQRQQLPSKQQKG
jgi:spore coat protein U-like protein